MALMTGTKPIKLSYCADERGEITGELEVRASLDTRSRPSVFDKELAMTAAGLSFASASRELLGRDLEALGCGRIRFYDSGTGDCAGLCLASRESPSGTQILAVLSGTKGEEWLSNFEIGYSARHLGFSRAADCAEQRLCEYLMSRPPRGEASFFVTGYSRGGAVADILSKRLCDRFGSDAVRSYAFASPNTTTAFRGARYDSLFSLIRDEDFFTRLPLSKWGYTRFGREVRLSGDVSRGYRSISGREYLGFTGTEAVDRAIERLTALAPNVHAYYERRFPVGCSELSLHEYMLRIAGILAGKAVGDASDVFLDGATSAYGELLEFMSSGADMQSLMSGGVPRCSAGDTHSPAAYVAAMQLGVRS